MLGSYGVFATAGSRFSKYGGAGGSFACKWFVSAFTNVDFPAPAMPMAITTTGFLFPASETGAVDVEAEAMGEADKLREDCSARHNGPWGADPDKL